MPCSPVLTLVPLLAALGCQTPRTGSDILGSNVDEVALEIGYGGENALPYSLSSPLGSQSWELIESNLAALFAGRSITLTVPADQSELDELDVGTQTAFSAQDVRNLAEAYKSVPNTDSTHSFYVMSLDGYYENSDGELAETTLGISVGDTIALFKRALNVTRAKAFTEQTTILHELGHALGLVNNGIPMVEDHQDAENGAHCDNPQCVMYWSNEGTQALLKFVKTFEEKGSVVLFGADCIADAVAAAQ